MDMALSLELLQLCVQLVARPYKSKEAKESDAPLR